ncbi:DUF6394 family protein [Arenicella xantha]|uniref:Uncharacterized protein n=1 Tax=Arenicella xantha TaxID=644221 RepID=A0A395JHJ4_9GAMM|nr:DUF6394 family protein [Arenicella xantha]RBP48329.1 hypothetical protein DFR28_10858 [Arenicella xantha]
MNFEKVVFAFFIILALSLNFGFFLGEISESTHHHPYELFAALFISLICTVMKFGDRTHFGSTVLASSLVVDGLLITAAITWALATTDGRVISPMAMASITSLAGGALMANLISVILLIIETGQIRK